MKTYEQAFSQQWSIAYHRIQVAKDNASKGKSGSCKCPDCAEHFAAISAGQEARDEEQSI